MAFNVNPVFREGRMKDEREAHEPVTLYLPKSLATRLRERAKSDERTISATAKIALEYGLDQKAEAA